MVSVLETWGNNALDFLLNRPLLFLFILGIPFFLAARFAWCYPTRRMLGWASVLLSLSLLIMFLPLVVFPLWEWNDPIYTREFYRTSLWVISLADLAFLAIIMGDLFYRPLQLKDLAIVRQFPTVASLDRPSHGAIELSYRGPNSHSIVLKDDFGDHFSVEPFEFELKLAPQSRQRCSYRVVPGLRGKFELEKVHLKAVSRLGLWDRHLKVDLPHEINVYPNIQQITEFELLAKGNRLSWMGLRRTRKIGQDNEFERLRDYSKDDNYRFIDWRTTARRQKLTVRDFQANQSQHVVFMIDCGRMMTAKENDISLLDHSLNAMLMLAYVALKRGDSVGMITFSNRIHNFTPAKGGVKHINRLLHASFDQQPEFVESRYDQAFLYLRSRFRKRALVVLITNVIDEINAHQIKQYLGKLTSHHLPLGVFLRDREMFSVVDEVDFDRQETVYRAAAAVDILSWRQTVLRDLQHQGVLALDLFADQITPALVNQYLEIKARHLL